MPPIPTTDVALNFMSQFAVAGNVRGLELSSKRIKNYICEHSSRGSTVYLHSRALCHVRTIISGTEVGKQLHVGATH